MNLPQSNEEWLKLADLLKRMFRGAKLRGFDIQTWTLEDNQIFRIRIGPLNPRRPPSSKSIDKAADLLEELCPDFLSTDYQMDGTWENFEIESGEDEPDEAFRNLMEPRRSFRKKLP